MSIVGEYEYFSVRKGSQADKAIDGFLGERREANDECFRWARRQGSRYQKFPIFGGRLCGLYYTEGKQPEGWIRGDRDGAWKPHSKKASKAYREMNRLPNIPQHDGLSKALGTKSELLIRGAQVASIGCGLETITGKRIVLIHPDQKRPTVKGLTKLSKSRYWKLKEAA